MTRPVKGAAYDELIANREFIAIDLETMNTEVTDSDSGTTLPVSVGCAVWRNGHLRGTEHWLIDPGIPMDAASSDYNGLNDPDLVGADTEATVMATLDAFLAAHPDAALVCHNAHFDIARLNESYDRSGIPRFSRVVFDTQFIGARIKVGGVPARVRLRALADRYGVDTTVAVPEDERHLYKAQKDAQDTAEVLGWLMAEAAKRGLSDFDAFVRAVKPKTSGNVTGTAMRRRRRMTPADVTDEHVKTCHSTPLPARPGAKRIDTWITQVRECVSLRCPYITEKVTIETRHAAALVPALSNLLVEQTGPGQMGTVLAGIEPLLVGFDRAQARAWYKTHHDTIRDAPACTPTHACPHCAQDRACPQDVLYQLLTRRALDFGGISLFSKQVKKDLYYGESARKIDTWPRAGMSDMAAYMMWVVITQAYAQRMTTKARDLLRRVMDRDLHRADPRLTLEAAKYLATSLRDAEVNELVTDVLSHANSDPGYLELEMWFSGPYKRALSARAASAKKKARPPAKGLRKPAAIEKRPAQVHHTYRYQLHRRADASTR